MDLEQYLVNVLNQNDANIKEEQASLIQKAILDTSQEFFSKYLLPIGFTEATIKHEGFQLLGTGSSFLGTAIDQSDLDFVIAFGKSISKAKLSEEFPVLLARRIKCILVGIPEKKVMDLLKLEIEKCSVDLVICQIEAESIPQDFLNSICQFSCKASRVAFQGLCAKKNLMQRIHKWLTFTRCVKLIKIFAKGEYNKIY